MRNKRGDYTWFEVKCAVVSDAETGGDTVIVPQPLGSDEPERP